MNSPKQLFIKGDLNALENGMIPLRNSRWISILEKEYGKIYDGMRIWLYEMTMHNDKMDPTVFPGVIKDLGKQDEYQILVDENDFEYLSESTKFKDYSIQDIHSGWDR